MSMREVKEKFKEGRIAKPDFIREMHQIHKVLFEYAQMIKNTDISEIRISDDLVIMTTRKYGIKMICNPSDERTIPIEILNFDSFEAEEPSLMLPMLNEGNVVLDIGANVGWYSILLSKLKSGCSIYAFEPIPETFSYLNKNLELNGIKSVKSFNFGLSNKEDEVIFYYNPLSTGNSSLANLTLAKQIEPMKCKVKKLDDFVSTEKIHVDFIKCDVEGAELFVFQGGINTIKQDRPIIFTEMLRKWAKAFNYHPNDTVRFFKALNYRCFSIHENQLQEFSEMDENTVETNFFFLNSVHHKKIIDRYVK